MPNLEYRILETQFVFDSLSFIFSIYSSIFISQAHYVIRAPPRILFLLSTSQPSQYVTELGTSCLQQTQYNTSYPHKAIRTRSIDNPKQVYLVYLLSTLHSSRGRGDHYYPQPIFSLHFSILITLQEHNITRYILLTHQVKNLNALQTQSLSKP